MTIELLPTYEIDDLPSKKLSYPENAKISVTGYTYGEVLNLQKVTSNGSAPDFFGNILKGVKCNFDKNLLTPQDVLFLGIYRKLVSTKHTQIEVQSVCPSCKYANSHTFDLKSLKFKGPQFETLPLVADLDKYKIHFELLTIGNFMECIKSYNGDSLATLASQVSKILVKNDEELEELKLPLNEKERTKKIRKILGSTVDEDRDVLDEASIILEDYGLKPLDVKCNDEFCEKNYEISLEDKDVLVFPFRGTEKSARNRISFGS